MFIKIGCRIQSYILITQLECPGDRRTIERICIYYNDEEIKEALKSTLYHSQAKKIAKDKISYFIGTLKRIRARGNITR